MLNSVVPDQIIQSEYSSQTKQASRAYGLGGPFGGMKQSPVVATQLNPHTPHTPETSLEMQRQTKKEPNPATPSQKLKKENLEKLSIYYLIQKAKQNAGGSSGERIEEDSVKIQDSPPLKPQANPPKTASSGYQSAEKNERIEDDQMREESKENIENKDLRSMLPPHHHRSKGMYNLRPMPINTSFGGGQPPTGLIGLSSFSSGAVVQQAKVRRSMNGIHKFKRTDVAPRSHRKHVSSGMQHKSTNAGGKNVSFSECLFNPQLPSSPNRPLLFSEFLRQKIGQKKFDEMTQFLKAGSENPVLFIEQHKAQITQIIGPKHADCIAILKYIFQSDVETPLNSGHWRSRSLQANEKSALGRLHTTGHLQEQHSSHQIPKQIKTEENEWPEPNLYIVLKEGEKDWMKKRELTKALGKEGRRSPFVGAQQ